MYKAASSSDSTPCRLHVRPRCGPCAYITGIQRDFGGRHHSRSARDGFPLAGGSTVMAGRGRLARAIYAGFNLDRGDCRLSANSIDGASAFSYPLIFLPFISSAFVPTDSMPPVVRAFAENQPVTSIVDAIRLCWRGSLLGMISGLHWHGASGSCSWLMSLRCGRIRNGFEQKTQSRYRSVCRVWWALTNIMMVGMKHISYLALRPHPLAPLGAQAAPS